MKEYGYAIVSVSLLFLLSTVIMFGWFVERFLTGGEHFSPACADLDGTSLPENLFSPDPQVNKVVEALDISDKLQRYDTPRIC